MLLVCLSQQAVSVPNSSHAPYYAYTYYVYRITYRFLRPYKAVFSAACSLDFPALPDKLASFDE